MSKDFVKKEVKIMFLYFRIDMKYLQDQNLNIRQIENIEIKHILQVNPSNKINEYHILGKCQRTFRCVK